MNMKIHTFVATFFVVGFFSMGSARSQVGGTPLGDVPMPTGGRVLRVSIMDLPSSAQAFLAPQLAKHSLKSGDVAAIAESRKRNVPLEYADASETRVHYLDRYINGANRDAHALGSLNFEMAELRNTAFAKFEFLGFVPEGTTPGGPWSWVARVFRAPDGSPAVLSEWDFGADDGGVLQIEEFLNANVGPNPGTLLKSTSKSKSSSLWQLSWVSGSKQMNFYYYCGTTNCPHADDLVGMAASLPTSAPKLQDLPAK